MEKSSNEDLYEDEGFICPACFIKFNDADNLFSHYESNHSDTSITKAPDDHNDDELINVEQSTLEQQERQVDCYYSSTLLFLLYTVQ